MRVHAEIPEWNEGIPQGVSYNVNGAYHPFRGGTLNTSRLRAFAVKPSAPGCLRATLSVADVAVPDWTSRPRGLPAWVAAAGHEVADPPAATARTSLSRPTG